MKIGLGIALLLASASAGATTLTFEGSSGTVGALAGVTFTDAVYATCGGGCPAPAFGQFVTGTIGSNPFTATFANLQSAVGFVNVSFSDVVVTAYDDGDAVVDTLASTTVGMPSALLVLRGPGIRYVVFGGSGQGIDDLVFDEAIAAVPEPSTWALLIGGFAMVGLAARRRRRAIV